MQVPWTRAGLARFAAAAAAVLLAGLLPGTDSVANGPDGTLTVVYSQRVSWPARSRATGSRISRPPRSPSPSTRSIRRRARSDRPSSPVR